MKGGIGQVKITKRRLALLGALVAVAAALAAPAAFAGTTYINGSLSPGDTQQTDRLFRDGVPQGLNNLNKYNLVNGLYWLGQPTPYPYLAWGVPYNPGVIGDAEDRAVDVYSFWNATNQPQQVTVRLRDACGPFDPSGINGFVAAYFSNEYDPTDPEGATLDGQSPTGQVLIGDAGQSGQPMQFNTVVNRFQTFEVVVSTGTRRRAVVPRPAGRAWRRRLKEKGGDEAR